MIESYLSELRLEIAATKRDIASLHEDDIVMVSRKNIRNEIAILNYF